MVDTNVDTTTDAEGNETETVKLYSAHDGLHGRSPGVYLDMEERKHAEILRATREGRDPVGQGWDDHSDLPPSTGTPLYERAWLGEGFNSYPSILHDGIIENDSDPIVEAPRPETPSDEVDLSYAAMVADERRAQEDSLTGTDSEPAPETVSESDSKTPNKSSKSNKNTDDLLS